MVNVEPVTLVTGTLVHVDDPTLYIAVTLSISNSVEGTIGLGLT